MGNDPKTSIVDRTCGIHDLDNVYVVDGSVQDIAYWPSANMVGDLPKS